MKLGTETGSFVNHVLATQNKPQAVVGMGCTVLSWTDRHAATVIKVTPKTITVQRDKATRTDAKAGGR